MKIGILTFYKSINCGSVLQAWALQKKLTNLGISSQIIQYEPKEYKRLYAPLVKPESWNMIKRNIKRIAVFKSIIHQIRLFRDFRNKHLILSTKTYSYESKTEEIASDYNCIICGSDQIWNLRALDCDPIFFLPAHLDIPKIAYATSPNHTIFDSLPNASYYKKWIGDFSSISVRERPAAERLESFLDHSKPVVSNMDPTLLLEQIEYEDIISERLIKEPYIFLYNAWAGEKVNKAAEAISKELNLKVITMFTKRDILGLINCRKHKIHIERKHSGPSDFLSLIKHADYVITDSFHGTAFSIIFQRQFICLNYRLKTNTNKDDERIMDLLGKLNLEYRYINCDQADTIKNIPPVDYNDVAKRKQENAESSLRWLRKALSEIG